MTCRGSAASWSTTARASAPGAPAFHCSDGRSRDFKEMLGGASQITVSRIRTKCQWGNKQNKLTCSAACTARAEAARRCARFAHSKS